MKKHTVDEFIQLAKILHGDKYDYSKVVYINNTTPIRIICPIHGEFEQTPKSHLRGYGCQKCAREYTGLRHKATKGQFIAKAQKLHGNKYNYDKVEYVDSVTPVCIICPKHGEFWQTPNDHLNGRGCPLCNESHLEISLRKFLGENKIGFEEHKHFGWLGRMELDFYIPSCNIGIECQGKQHVGLGGWKEGFDFRGLYERDKRKNELCKENGVRLFYCFSKESFKKKNEFPIYNDENSFVEIEELMVAFSKDGFSVH